MPTKRANPSTDPLERFNDALRRPHTWRITGIDAFWLEDPAERRITIEFPDIEPVYDAVLTEIGRGSPADDVVLVGREPGGRKTVLGGGADLQDVAEAHAGLPARRRRPIDDLAVTREPRERGFRW
jgi:hypothetical protein